MTGMEPTEAERKDCAGADEELAREAVRFHERLFGEKPPQKLLSQYALAHREHEDFRSFPSEELASVKLVLDRGLDPLCIEPWLRGRRRRHALSAKLLLISHLAECGSYRELFARRFAAAGAPAAFLQMGLKGCLGAIALARGWLLKRRHGIV